MKGILTLVLGLFLFVNVYADGNDTIIQNGNRLEYTSKWEDGTLKTKGVYTLDKQRTGEWVNYYQNGQISTIAHFKDDKKIGVWEHYDVEGRLVALITYKKDELMEYYSVSSNGGLTYHKKG